MGYTKAMEVSIKQIELVLQSPIGPINEMRRQRLAEVIGPSFQLGNINIPGAAAFVNQSNGITLVVTDSQLVFRQEGTTVQSNINSAKNLLTEMASTLLIEDRMPGAMQIIAHGKSEVSTTELSVEYFSSMTGSELRRRFNGLRGIGLRITFEQQPYTCDLHLEPFFADPTLFFIRLAANTTQPTSISRLVDDADTYIDYTLNDVPEFLGDMRSEEA